MKYPGARGALCIFLFLALLFASTGQTAPVWEASYTGSTNSTDIANNLLLGHDGSVYVTGYSYHYLYYPTSAATIVKYSASGQQLWVAQNTNISRIQISNPDPLTALDSGDASRVVGSRTSNMKEVAVASYSSEGALLWERYFIQGVESQALAIGVDAASNTVVIGSSGPEFAYDAFILKYAADGSLLWSRIFTLSPWSSDRAFSLATLYDGAILVGVYVESGGPFLIKYTPEGELLWAKNLADQGFPWQMKVDSAQNIIAAVSAVAAPNSLLKLDPQDGAILWQTRADFTLRQIAVDADDNIYATGSGFREPTILVKYSQDGVEQWRSQPVHADYGIEPVGIAVSPFGVAMGLNVWDSSVLIGPFNVFHFTPHGVEVWRESYDQRDHLSFVIGDPSGAVYLTGGRVPANLSSDFQTLKFQPTNSPSLPSVIALPQDLNVVAGTNRAVFSVEAGNGPNTFQWRFRGAAIRGATNAILELHDIQLTNAGPYSVIVSNSSGYIVTPDARLTVYEPPAIYWRWDVRTNEVAIVGNQFLLPTIFDGSPPITFEWYKDGLLLGQTNSMFVTDELRPADAGIYTVVARSPYGAATNAPLVLTVVDRSPLDDWRWVRPRPQGNSLTAVAFGNSRFVAVGHGGTLLTSSDGLSWVVTNLHRSDLTGIAFGNGSFVAVSYMGAIYTSVDGFSWTQRQGSTTPDGFSGIAFLNNRFIISGSTTRSSIDAVTWIDHGPSPGSSRALAFGQGTYLRSGFGYYMISTNLSDWTRFPLDELLGLNSVAAYGNGLFVFGGGYDLYTSPDGIEITSHRSSSDPTVLAFVNNGFFAFGNRLERSSDGITWSHVSMNADDKLQSVAFGNGVYVAVGYDGMIVRSSDGNNWTQVSDDYGWLWLRLLAYGNGHYVAVAEEDTWSSGDGDTWTSVGPLQGYPTAITWANDRFVVVCAEGDIHTSMDGVRWTHLSVTTNYLSDVIHDGQRFVAVGTETVLISTNGTLWHRVPIAGAHLNTIAYGKGLYLANGWISTNAVNWTKMVGPASAYASGIAYGNGKFVGVAGGNAIVSDDGRTWDSYEISGQYFDSIIHAAGIFVALSSYAPMATSTNGRDWVMRQTFIGPGVAYANGALWSAGEYESIRRSAQLEPFLRTHRTGSAIELIVDAYPGQSCRLQRANVLGTWNDFQTFTPLTETTTFIDNIAGNAFYRILSP